jgi:inner membrane protein
VILGLVVYGFAKRHTEANWVACAFALAYFGFGAVQNRQAAETLTDLAESRGHDDAERFTVKPSIGNLALWRGIYDFENRYYVDGIRVDYLGSGTRVYPGGSVEKVDLGSVKETLSENSILSKDVDRFYWFSDGYLGWHPERQNIIGDVRYAVLPTSTIPLWGIEIESVHENHAPFINFRTTDKDTIDRLWKMIIGRDL